MALYATTDQVRSILTRDDARVEGTGAVLSDADIDQALADAGAEINSRLGQVYSVPFDPVPPLVENLAINIAGYLVHLTYRENRELASDLNPLALRYQRAQTIMAQLVSGESVIPPSSPDPSDPPSRGTQLAATITRPPLFVPSDFSVRKEPYHDPASPEWWGIE